VKEVSIEQRTVENAKDNYVIEKQAKIK